MGTISEFGGRVGVTYFTDTNHSPRHARLVATVAWRHDRPSVPPRAMRIWQHLWSLLRRRGRDVSAIPDWQPPRGWAGSAAAGGTREVLYHATRRLVRVLGRDFPLPADGRALVLLVDEGAAPPGEGPAITVCSTECPLVPEYSCDRTVRKATNLERMSASWREQRDAWSQALRSDPVVRAFLEAPMEKLTAIAPAPHLLAP